MAKSSSFFGLRTGSTKSLTFAVLRGQQITKDRVTRVSNPRSEAQMAQRALIPIVAAARTQLKGLVDHSFEGVAYGEASLREFSKLNLRAGSLDVTSFSPNGVSNAGFANLQVSKGTINGSFSTVAVQETGTIYKSKLKYNRFAFPACAPKDPATKIFNYLETWAKENNAPMLMPGTQLSFLTIYEAGSVKVRGLAGDKDASVSAFIINRFMIPKSETDQTQLDNVNGQWKVAYEVKEGDTSATIVNIDGDEIHFECDAPGGSQNNVLITITTSIAKQNNSNCGGALILSRYENGTWRRSTASINIGFEPKNKYTFDDWLSVYQATGAASKKYLNNGDGSTGIHG